MKRLQQCGYLLITTLALGILVATTASANPTILPTPTEKAPLNFSGASDGKTTTTLTQEGPKGEKHQVKCEKVTVLKSAFTSSEKAKDVHLLFEGNCKLTSPPETKCKSEDSKENGLILLLADVTLVDILPGGVLSLGVLIETLNLKLELKPIVITCGVAKVEILGAFIGKVDGPKTLVKTKSAEILVHEVGGVQEFLECDELVEICLEADKKTHKKFDIAVQFEAGEGFRIARKEATIPITFETEAEVHF